MIFLSSGIFMYSQTSKEHKNSINSRPFEFRTIESLVIQKITQFFYLQKIMDIHKTDDKKRNYL